MLKGRVVLAVGVVVGLFASASPAHAAGADPVFSCNHDPCTNLPYSFTVTVNGMVVPNMDDNLFGFDFGDTGSPLVPTNEETYVTNPDGTVTGTVTGNVTVGLAVSQPLANDVTVYFEGELRQDGQNCDGPDCVIFSAPCVLAEAQTSASCDVSDWWQSYSSALPLGTAVDYNLIYTDPGQPGGSDVNNHPSGFGIGFVPLTAFTPTVPPQQLSAPKAQPAAGRSFLVRYRPTFAANFTLNVKRGTKVLARRYLGWQKAGAYSVRFWCGTRTGNLTLVVAGTRRGNVQRSNQRTVAC